MSKTTYNVDCGTGKARAVSEYTIVEAFGLQTRTWTFSERSGYGCSECCNGDRCDEDCTAKYKGRRKSCPHCKGRGWIPKEDATVIENTELIAIGFPHSGPFELGVDCEKVWQYLWEGKCWINCMGGKPGNHWADLEIREIIKYTGKKEKVEPREEEPLPDREEENRLKVYRFAAQMLIELDHNKHKESIFTWDDFNDMITELEYHKSKMFLAVRTNNKGAIKEYIADTANILMAIGNYFTLYEYESRDTGSAYEINKEVELIKEVSIENQSKGQSIISNGKI